MPSPSMGVRKCGNEFARASKRRQSYRFRQYLMSARALSRGTPCVQSPTVSRSGYRVESRRCLRSSIAVWGSDIVNGEIASVADGTTIDVDWASAADDPATVADAAPAANRNNSRRDAPFKSGFLNLLCIVSALREE